MVAMFYVFEMVDGTASQQNHVVRRVTCGLILPWVPVKGALDRSPVVCLFIHQTYELQARPLAYAVGWDSVVSISKNSRDLIVVQLLHSSTFDLGHGVSYNFNLILISLVRDNYACAGALILCVPA